MTSYVANNEPPTIESYGRFIIFRHTRQALIILLAAAILGCTQSIVLPADETLSHEEVVTRLKPLLPVQFRLGASERRISSSVTELAYIGTFHPPSGLATVGSFDVTYFYIDTSGDGEVKISVKSLLRGDRQYEMESRVIRELSGLQERAGLVLRPTPEGS